MAEYKKSNINSGEEYTIAQAIFTADIKLPQGIEGLYTKCCISLPCRQCQSCVCVQCQRKIHLTLEQTSAEETKKLFSELLAA